MLNSHVPCQQKYDRPCFPGFSKSQKFSRNCSTFSNLLAFFSDSYLREVAAAQQIQAMAAVNAAAAIASANNNPEVAHKRPRLEMTHLAAPAPAISSASSAASTISQPLRIDTREAVKVRKTAESPSPPNIVNDTLYWEP